MAGKSGTLKQWTKRFQYKGVRYSALFTQRPFREGLEVSLELDGTTISVAELGLGQKALIECLKHEIDRHFGEK